MESLEMDTEELYEDAPPDYNSLSDLSTLNKTVHIAAFHNAIQDPPPSTRWLVRSEKEPPTWKLLTGPLMSNATAQINPDPCRKRRYRVLYPANYEDVYLHKAPWTKHADALPNYHVELYGRDRYEPEPIVILGPPNTSHSGSCNVQADTRAIAASSLPRVLSTLEDQVVGMTRTVTFVGSEYWSWDWKVITAASNHDMRAMILRAKQVCAKSAMLIDKTEEFLRYLGQEESFHRETLVGLRKSVEEAKRKFRRLRM